MGKELYNPVHIRRNSDEYAFSNFITISLKNLDIVGSIASKSGGGIYIYHDPTSGFVGHWYKYADVTYLKVIMENLRLNGNSAGAHGGAVYVEGARIEARIQSSTLSGNDASNNGGAIFFSVGDQNALTVSRSTIDANSAGDYGGGIWIKGNGGVDKTWLVDNSAGKEGGAVFVESSPFVANVTIISNNQAVTKGAGVYAQGNYSVIIKNSTLLNNLSQEKGDIFVLSRAGNEDPPQFMALNSAIEKLHFTRNDQNKTHITYTLRNNFIKEVIGISMEELGRSNTKTQEFGYKDIRNNDFSLNRNSPLIGKADEAKASIEDITLTPRDSNPDVGAVEYPHKATLKGFKDKLFTTPLGCSQDTSRKEYEEGFKAGQEYCKENPQECGIPIPKEWNSITPKEEVIKKLKNRSFRFNGYYVHYGDGAFDWIYVNRNLSVVAKLEEGCKEDGNLRWNYIHLETDPAFESIKVEGDKIIFGDETSN